MLIIFSTINCLVVKKMKNNIDDLLISACKMLRDPNGSNYLKTETMCLSLEILNERIINANCSDIFDQDVSEQEYEYYFEKLFTNFTELDLDVIMDEIKQDIKNMGDTNEND